MFVADLITLAGFDLREGRRLLGWLEVLQAPARIKTLAGPIRQTRNVLLDKMIRELDERQKAN